MTPVSSWLRWWDETIGHYTVWPGLAMQWTQTSSWKYSGIGFCWVFWASLYLQVCIMNLKWQRFNTESHIFRTIFNLHTFSRVKCTRHEQCCLDILLECKRFSCCDKSFKNQERGDTSNSASLRVQCEWNGEKRKRWMLFLLGLRREMIEKMIAAVKE